MKTNKEQRGNALEIEVYLDQSGIPYQQLDECRFALLDDDQQEWGMLIPKIDADEELEGRLWELHLESGHIDHDWCLSFFIGEASDVGVAIGDAWPVYETLKQQSLARMRKHGEHNDI